ncbi:MAG: c-type cytochrome domain-containing protein [Opitutales bacterium]
MKRARKATALLALAVIASVAMAVEPFRDFSSNRGQVLNARLIGVKGDQVAIQTRDGKTHVLSVFKLSLPDQIYVRQAAQRGNLMPKPTTPATPTPVTPRPGQTNPTPNPNPTQPVAPVATGPATVDFTKHVLPIFNESCNDCHKAPFEKNNRTIKPKAGLRLDTFEATMKGSTDGRIVTPGKPEDSVLYELISLEPDDDDIMPPKGDPLTAQQIEIIRKWISEGTRSSITAAAPVGPVGPNPNAPGSKVSPLDNLAASANVRPLGPDAISIASKNGAQVTPLSENHPFVRIEFVSIAGSISDSEIGRIIPTVRFNLAQLDLSKTKVTDKGMLNVGKCRNLTHLNLRQTQIGDDGLSGLRNLENLWYLNLLNTKVTNRGLSTLAEMKNLKEIYLWQSSVTLSGVQELRGALPNTKIVF